VANSKEGNSAAAVGGVLGIFAVIAGVYAMIQPMNQRIDQLHNRVKEMSDKSILDDIRDREDARQFAAMEERFKEVKTQFKASKELSTFRANRIETIIDTFVRETNRRLLNFENVGNPRLDERVKSLERIVIDNIK
jgi:hypothetical protein